MLKLLLCLALALIQLLTALPVKPAPDAAPPAAWEQTPVESVHAPAASDRASSGAPASGGAGSGGSHSGGASPRDPETASAARQEDGDAATPGDEASAPETPARPPEEVPIERYIGDSDEGADDSVQFELQTDPDGMGLSLDVDAFELPPDMF